MLVLYIICRTKKKETIPLAKTKRKFSLFLPFEPSWHLPWLTHPVPGFCAKTQWIFRENLDSVSQVAFCACHLNTSQNSISAFQRRFPTKWCQMLASKWERCGVSPRISTRLGDSQRCECSIIRTQSDQQSFTMVFFTQVYRKKIVIN